MSSVLQKTITHSKELGIEVSVPFESNLLRPEQRIRALCFENKCGQFDNHYMCPPFIGSIDEITERLESYKQGILFQYCRILDVRNDIAGLRDTKTDFHKKILQMEDTIRLEGVSRVWGMIGGNCELCSPCSAKKQAPCEYPDKARTSLESIAMPTFCD